MMLQLMLGNDGVWLTITRLRLSSNPNFGTEITIKGLLVFEYIVQFRMALEMLQPDPLTYYCHLFFSLVLLYVEENKSILVLLFE